VGQRKVSCTLFWRRRCQQDFNRGKKDCNRNTPVSAGEANAVSARCVSRSRSGSTAVLSARASNPADCRVAFLCSRSSLLAVSNAGREVGQMLRMQRLTASLASLSYRPVVVWRWLEAVYRAVGRRRVACQETDR